MFYSVLLYNTRLNLFSISCLSSGEVTISSTFLEFISHTGFGLTICSAILFPINFPVASAFLWTTSLEAVFKAYISVFLAVPNRG